MITTIVIILFILWLLGVLGVYSIGWIYHIFLVASIMVFFIAGIRAKNPEITEIMFSDGLTWEEAEKIREIMHKNKLGQKEAIELFRIRSNPHVANNHELMQTEMEQVREIVTKNKLSMQEAVELLSIRLRLRNQQ